MTGTGWVKSLVTSRLKHLYRVGKFTGIWWLESLVGEITGTGYMNGSIS